MNDYLTIPQFAKQAGCTKQYLYNQLTGKFVNYYKEENGKKYLQKDALRLVKQKSEVDNQLTGQVYRDELIQSLKEQVDNLKKQIDNLNQALNHEQMLHAQALAQLSETTQRLYALENRQAAQAATRDQETGNAADQESSDQETRHTADHAADPAGIDPPQATTAPTTEPEPAQATAAPSQEPLQGTQAADTHSQAVEPSQATDTHSQEPLQATQEPEPQEADKPSLWARFLAFLGF